MKAKTDDNPEEGGVGGSVSSEMMTGNDDNNAKKCLFTKKGVCQEHLVPGKKLVIPSKVWKDRGGGVVDLVMCQRNLPDTSAWWRKTCAEHPIFLLEM